jgi:murein DD-endopeptidase MepM/ murein hydrolase activator NlpD
MRTRLAAGGAMLAAALMAITCSVPASAASTQLLATPPTGVVVTAGAQTLESGTGTPASVARDGYTVAVPAPIAVPAAAPHAYTAAGLVLWPVSASTAVSGSYGPRSAPCAGCSTFHKGADLTPGKGSPIQATADGVVRSVSAVDDGGLGVHAVIDHVIDGQKVSSVYGHMIQGSLQLRAGQTVTAGELVGNVGSTGQSTGPHLHFEILLGGTEPTDPLAWLAVHAS